MTRSSASLASPLADLIEEARLEGRRVRQARPTAAAPRPVVLPELRFLAGAPGVPESGFRSRRGLTLPVSLALHAAGVAALALTPLLLSESLPDPAFSVRAFFVEPVAPPLPPPPPPPAAGPRAATRSPNLAPVTSVFTAPIEVPEEIKPDAGIDLGLPGVVGGVEGGVPGGVVGGVVGGLTDAPAPSAAPVRVGGLVKAPRKIRHVDPAYPTLALQARLEGIVIVEAVVDAGGNVTDARILRGIPMLDAAALEAVRQWGYTPTLLNGVPTPIIMTVTVSFVLA
ncbi:MAG TPA: energy transducer TonB [Vicinamibacteria bacterium]|nr:energy transducer TonB [Vicinamibacteria bacterium]